MDIVSALDKQMAKKIGEKGHVENCWSFNPDELVVQFFFQLVRSKDTSVLEQKLEYLLKRMTFSTHSAMLTILYKLIGQTRDIVEGKGECDLTWMQLEVWYRYYPELAYKAFFYCVDSQHKDLNNHQYGSWKDVKYFLAYLKQKNSEDHPLVDKILREIVVPALKRDKKLYMEDKPVSLIGRWIPREKSSKKFNWIFKRLSEIMYPEFAIKPPGGWKNTNQQLKGTLKQKIHLKKLLVMLSGKNGGSDTPQVKMAGRCWGELDFNKLTSITLRNQKRAILNKDKKGSQRSQDVDRIACAVNYTEHVKKCLSGDKFVTIKGKRLDVGQLAKDGYSYDAQSDDVNKTLRNTINLQWKSQSQNNKGLESVPIVAMADTSGSMETDDCLPLNNSIGLAIRISEICHPAFRNRILTFDTIPKWINLEDCPDFVAKAKKVRNASWGMNTDFHLALDEMIKALVENDTNPVVVKKMVLAVFSDMQFDQRDHNINIFDNAYEVITKKFYNAGISTSHRTPYEPPHILFWNLRKTQGFPSTTLTKNITFLSGYSSTLLNTFTNKGIDALREVTPKTMLYNLLNTKRYSPLDENIKNLQYFS
jgi:hypothetical protein